MSCVLSLWATTEMAHGEQRERERERESKQSQSTTNRINSFQTTVRDFARTREYRINPVKLPYGTQREHPRRER
jgi:uncharacterized membrane protein